MLQETVKPFSQSDFERDFNKVMEINNEIETIKRKLWDLQWEKETITNNPDFIVNIMINYPRSIKIDFKSIERFKNRDNYK